MLTKVETVFWEDFLLALRKFYQKCSSASLEEFRLALLWYNDMGNLILTNKWFEKGIVQVKDALDLEGELVEITVDAELCLHQSNGLRNYMYYINLVFPIY